MSQNGKGSARRPARVAPNEFSSNWERTFSRREPPIEYTRALQGGMFYELFPNLTGIWESDKVLWEQIHT